MEQAKPAWEPDHPETAPTWLPRRILLEYGGAYTIDHVQSMTLEEMADALEALQVSRDVQMAGRLTDG